VYKLDRFARKLTILLEVIEQLEEIGVWFMSTQESLDTSSAFWKAMLWIMWVFSELERDMIQERTQMWIIEWLEQGSRYSLRRYWYIKSNEKWTVTVVDDEAEIVNTIYSMLVYDNKSITEIRNHLENTKTKNPSTSMKWYWWKRSKRWPYSWADRTVRTILRDELYV
jgi:site-specific DNA recombinase